MKAGVSGSRILSLDEKTVHVLKEDQKRSKNSKSGNKNKGNKAEDLIIRTKVVGFGKECLLCIGELDIVISVGNLNNFCFFPKSFCVDEEGLVNSAEKLIGGKTFEVKELAVFELIA